MRSDYGKMILSPPFTFISASQCTYLSSERAPQSAAGILPADLTLPESGAMLEGFCTIRTADPIIIQFDLPAGCRKHFKKS